MTNARSQPPATFSTHVLQPPFRSLAPFIHVELSTYIWTYQLRWRSRPFSGVGKSNNSAHLLNCLSRIISIYPSVIRVMRCDYLSTTVAYAAVLVVFVGTKPTANPPT